MRLKTSGAKKAKKYVDDYDFVQTWVERREWWEDRAEGDPLPGKLETFTFSSL